MRKHEPKRYPTEHGLLCFVYFGNNDISIEKLVLVSGRHQKSSLGGFVNVYVVTKES